MTSRQIEDPDGNITVINGLPDQNMEVLKKTEQEIDQFTVIRQEIARSIEQNKPDEYVIGLTKLLQAMQAEVEAQHLNKLNDHDLSFMSWKWATDNFVFQTSNEIKEGIDQYRPANTLNNQQKPHFAYPVGFGRDNQSIDNSAELAHDIASFVNARGGGYIMARPLDCTSKSDEANHTGGQHSAYVVSTKLIGFKQKTV